MKGIELPINLLIILIIAMVILVAVSAFFLGVWKPTSSGVSLDAAKSLACKDYVAVGCTNLGLPVREYDIDSDGSFDPGTTCFCDSGSHIDCSSGSLTATGGGCASKPLGDNFALVCAKYCPPYSIGTTIGSDFIACCKKLCGCT